MNIETALKEAMNIEGAIGAALADRESGMPLDRTKANLALARHHLKRIEGDPEI
jgi:hypothetical protein